MTEFCCKKSHFLLYLLIFTLASGCSKNEPSPPVVSLLPYSSVTHHSLFSIRGTKNPGNAIYFNNQMVIPFDNSGFWSGEVNLSAGNNLIFIKSVNSLGNESPSVQLNVTLDTSSPSSPVMTSSLSSAFSPILIGGTKDRDADVLLNGKEIVSFTPSTAWAYSYSPLQVTTPLQLTSQNRLGNSSPITTATLVYAGIFPPTTTSGLIAPFLISPLDGDFFKNTAVTQNILFSWTNTLSMTYRIQISDTPDFSSTTTINTTLSSTPYSLDLAGNPLLKGDYYWRVGAYDVSLNNLYYSHTRRFLFGKVSGDFNGDGYADILIGAEGTKGPGQVRVFLGGTSAPKLKPDLTLSGENGGDLFGTALAAGDLNGDGYDDIIVGAYHNGAGGERTGRVYIYFGGPTLHATPDVILTGFSAGEQFGVSVSSGQDINRDGYDDLLVGANLNSVKGAYTGRAYLFLGGQSISPYPDMVFNGEAPGDHFGISVAMAGDINGDGFPDFLIGAGGDGSNTHTGKAYLYYGEWEPGNQPQMVFTGNSTGDGFGRMVTGVKDVNGDGYDDFLIGAPFHTGPTGKLEAGEAYLFQGGANLNTTPDLVLRLPNNVMQDQANFGFSAASLGDIPSKDGYADFVVGAYGQVTKTHIENGTTVIDAAAGMAHLYKGNNLPSPTETISLYSGNDTSNESFGLSLSSPGDFNGDGFPDLIIGAMRADQSTGRAYYYDSFSLSNPLPCTICLLSGVTAQEGFGFAVH